MGQHAGPAVHTAVQLEYSLPLEDQFAHADQVLGDFCESLLAFVSDESGPVD